MSADAERLARVTRERCATIPLPVEWSHPFFQSPLADAVFAIDNLLDALAARDAELARLREAASSLVGELTGAFGIAEPEIRAALGNTNVTCLKNRHGELAARLAPAAPTHAANCLSRTMIAIATNPPGPPIPGPCSCGADAEGRDGE